jgi:hypothetical protein
MRAGVSKHPDLSRNPPPACLWKENPNRLVTLWDIVRDFNLLGLFMARNSIQMLEHQALKLVKKQHGGVPMPDRQIKSAQTLLRHSTDFLAAAEFADSKEALTNFLESLDDDGLKEAGLPVRNMDVSTFLAAMEHLEKALDKDINEHKYIQVMPDRIECLSPVTLFGAKVFSAFPDARIDIADAGYCLAVELHTAAVFHLMRVAEYGLRALARKVGAKLTDKRKKQPLEFAEWGKVITRINDRIGEANAKLPKGPKLNARVHFYSEAADHCLYLKAVRNEISHTRTNYNGPEALGVMERVRSFMVFLERGLQKPA